MVVTICPPAGTSAINMTVLAHIPEAIKRVDSAPSSALFKPESTHDLDGKENEKKKEKEKESKMGKTDLIFSSATTVVGFP